MAFNWTEGVFRNSRHTGTDLLLLLILADSADRDTGACYPGVKTIARLMRTSERNVQKRLKALRESEEITVRYQKSPFGTNLYVLNRSLLGDELQDTPYAQEKEGANSSTSPESTEGELQDIPQRSGEGELQDTQGVNHSSPKPLVEPKDKEGEKNPSGSQRKPTPRPTRIDDEWIPSTYQLTYAAEQGMNQSQIRKTADNFRDYWLSTGKTKVDWDATWRSWVRRDLEQPTNGHHRPKKPDFGQLAREMRRQEEQHGTR